MKKKKRVKSLPSRRKIRSRSTKPGTIHVPGNYKQITMSGCNRRCKKKVVGEIC